MSYILCISTKSVKKMAYNHEGLYEDMKLRVKAIERFDLIGTKARIDRMEDWIDDQRANGRVGANQFGPLGNQNQDDQKLNELQSDVAKIEFELALLSSRSGADPLTFGDIELPSYADTLLFVTDDMPVASFGCFFDFIALMDSLRDTRIDEKGFVEAEYNAQKTKLTVAEVAISASFLHLSPLCFCNSKTDEGNFGSISRSLPLVKNRESWVSQGGAEGMKRMLDMEIINKVQGIQKEIFMTLGSSRGASLAQRYLTESHACYMEFGNWTESFYHELIAMSHIDPKEAWTLILQCWLAFFKDLRKIRIDCSALSPAGLDPDSAEKKELVARYLWTMGHAIKVQNDYRDMQFRNHSSIASVINFHLFQHRVPTSLYNTAMSKVEGDVKSLHVWKGQVVRDIKKLQDRS